MPYEYKLYALIRRCSSTLYGHGRGTANITNVPPAAPHC